MGAVLSLQGWEEVARHEAMVTLVLDLEHNHG